MAKKQQSYAEIKASMAKMEEMLKEKRKRASEALGEGLVDDEVVEALDGLSVQDVKKLAAELRPELVRRAAKMAGQAADPVSDGIGDGETE